MESGRYGGQQGLDNNSAPEGYATARDPNYRYGGSYDERYNDERFSRDDVYDYPPGNNPMDVWPPSRRRDSQENYPRDRESRRHEKPYIDSYHAATYPHDNDIRGRDGYNRDHGYERSSRYDNRDRDDYDYEHRSRYHHHTREVSRESDYDYARRSYDSDYERGSGRDVSRKSRESRDREWDKRCYSHEREESSHTRNERSRSRSQSRGFDQRSRSRSPRGRSYGRNYRDDSYDDDHWNEKTDRRREHDHFSSAPSATVVVKGLSMQTTEDDLYQILAEWGPLHDVRVIKERTSGTSRGFAFIDFPSVEAACAMIDRIGHDGLIVDGRKLFFHYRKPTGRTSGSYGHENASKLRYGGNRNMMVPADWMCTICGCINFARRTSCFQCNEPKTDDAPPADVGLSNSTQGKRGSEAGPSNVLVVRGLDENADEEMIRYEFSKHAPIKDLRLVKDKFTHVSRGFAFIHFHSVEDATKALEETNGTALERNGRILRVAYAKSPHGSGASSSAPSQSSSLAAAAIEAAAFSQQYDAVGWAPKEYNPDDNSQSGGQNQGVGEVEAQKGASAPQSGFVWDEASGYYYDAASGYYYDGNTGLYYDSSSWVWYSYDPQTQQYIPCPDQSNEGKSVRESAKIESSNSKKVVISAPAATIPSAEKSASLPDAVQAAAAAAMAAEKKDKERAKEIKLASKSILLANKKKMNNVLSMWKQRSHETQTPRIALEDNSSNVDSVGHFKGKSKSDAMITKESSSSSAPLTTAQTTSSSTGGALTGVIRGSLRGVVKLDSTSTVGPTFSSTNTEVSSVTAPFRTDISALGSYTSPAVSGTGRRRFSELPSNASSAQRDHQPQTSYRDRAAERRNLYGSTSTEDDLLDGASDSYREYGSRKGSLDPTPFPPGVGGGRVVSSESVQNYDVITAEKAIDESNVGNRMLRNMGWHEGSGLGKDGSGMIEPVQAQAVDRRAGLGSQQKKVADPSLEVQAGDSYKTLIHKKSVARFREMTESER